jgi:hypothetical protein
MPQGTLTEYGLTAGLPRDFDPLIYLLSREFDLVLQGGGYSADGRTVLSMGSAEQKKVEWQDEELLLPRSSLAVAMTDAQTTVNVGSDNERLKFQTGDVIKIEDERVLVTGYNAGAGLLNVTRGFQSTTAAAHVINTPIKGIGSALAEGSQPQEIRALDRTDRHNLTQIFGPVEVKVSGTKQATARYGVSAGSEFNKQAANRLSELLTHCEQSLIHGIRWEDTGTERRTMGGLTYYITVNNDSSTTALSYSTLRTQGEAIFQAGGRPDRLLIPVTQKSNIDDIDSSDIRLVRTDGGRGQVVEQLVSSWSVLDVVVSREIERDTAVQFSRDQAVVKTLRPFQFVPLAKVGDSVRGMWVGEKTLAFQGDRHAGKFTNLT